MMDKSDWLPPLIAMLGAVLIMGLALLLVAVEYHAITGDWF